MEWLNLIGTIVGVVGGLIGIGGGVLSFLEWRRIRRKIIMLTDASAACEVLPAWYTSRMMDEHWCFGLLTQSGTTIAITKIKAISDDGKWMDVDLASPDAVDDLKEKVPELIGAIANDRTTASVQISNIVAARDLWAS